MLPQDPNILLSYINTKLRDNYPSLDAAKAALTEKLAKAGYVYNAAQNRFV